MMAVHSAGGVEEVSRISLENQFVASTFQSGGKVVQKRKEEISAGLSWDRELDIVIIKLFKGSRVIFQVPPDVIIEMAKYQRRNFLKGILVDRTI
jgi:uncharacterized FlaG/YvyC family protein